MTKLKQERTDGADAFIPESAQVSGTSDGLAELLAEDYLREASGDEPEEIVRDEAVPEELGGPFVESRPEREFDRTREAAEEVPGVRAKGARPTSPRTLRSPLPQAVGPLAIAAPDEDVANEETSSDVDGVPLAASDVRTASLASEPGARTQPDVEIDSPASTSLKT